MVKASLAKMLPHYLTKVTSFAIEEVEADRRLLKLDLLNFLAD